MKKRNIIIFIAILLLVIAIFLVSYFVFIKKDKESTLTLIEKQWIENNKNSVIDFGIVNNVPILNNAGEGLFFSFIGDLEEKTGLSFNKVSYNYGDNVSQSYAFKVVKKVSSNDILVYTDNYALVSKYDYKYNNLSEIKNAQVGVLRGSMDDVSKYLNSSNLSYVAYNSITELLNAYEASDSTLNYIVLPKLVLLGNYTTKNPLYINYNITEMKDNYVISLGNSDKLNDIIKKYYLKWSDENYNNTFATMFSDEYFDMVGADEESEVKFKSKRYVYGYVDNGPFDLDVDNKLVGMNNSLIQKFANFSDLEITYQHYSSVEELRQAFAQGKIDFYFDKYDEAKYDLDYFDTVSSYDEQIVIVSNYDKDLLINSVNSLSDIKIATLSNSKIATELTSLNANVKTYKSVSALLNNLNDDSIVAIDKATYDFYKDKYFKDFKVDYQFALNSNYTFKIRDVKNNKLFENFFDFYLSFVNEKNITNDGYYSALDYSSTNSLLKELGIGVVALFVLLISFCLGSRFMPNRRKKKNKLIMRKEDKLRYIDMLTSLKNRNYLNDNIEKWDASEVYPQAIIIIDLNNIAYVNDNYGHQEGDEVIRQAANILIKNQYTNSDIIRTNGNEFLIYLVGYDEKQIVAYIKKLQKDLKELDHGFGAALGYSIINDGIKTIDDAVNEATLDMRNNKEELNN